MKKKLTVKEILQCKGLKKLTEIGKAMNQKPSWAKATLEEFSKIASTLPTDGEITTDMLKDMLGTGKLDRIQKLSIMFTLYFLFARNLASDNPIKPAPPVIKIFFLFATEHLYFKIVF